MTREADSCLSRISSKERCDSLEPKKRRDRKKQDLIVVVKDITQFGLWQPKRKQIGDVEDSSSKLLKLEKQQIRMAVKSQLLSVEVLPRSQVSEESKHDEEEDGLTEEEFKKTEIYRLLIGDVERKFGTSVN